MLRRLSKHWEFAIDYRQWAIGFNFYRDKELSGYIVDTTILNIFIGPIRFGYYKNYPFTVKEWRPIYQFRQ